MDYKFSLIIYTNLKSMWDIKKDYPEVPKYKYPINLTAVP